MVIPLRHDQVLAWRLERHFLEPIGSARLTAVVDRLCGVQAQVASSAELAIGVRRSSSTSGDVTRALRDGRLLKTWAMRGALHLVTPELGPSLLAVVASGRSWERPSWQRAFGLTTDVMDRFRDAARDLLDGRQLTREELGDEISRRKGLEHLGDGLRSGWGTLLKPLAFQGELCFGPSRGSRVTFTRPETASRRWPGLPPLDEAVPRVMSAYLGAYGPATIDRLGAWLAGGWFGTRQIRGWLEALGSDLATVHVEGTPAYALAADVDAIASAPRSNAIRLLPGFDQWVLGPGTADGVVTPKERRAEVSRQAGWISPVVIVGGVVRGTWDLRSDRVAVSWFPEGGRLPRTRLAEEVERVSTILGRDLVLEASRE
jgi:hypothetical protein